jgi:phosphomannomutase
MIDDVAAARNGVVLRTPVGEAHVVEAMRKNTSPIGGEGNGGVIWPAVTYIRDSLSSMALTLALLAGAVHGKRVRLSELVAQTPAYAIEKRKVDLASKDLAKPAVEAIARTYASEKVDRQDGVRVDFAARRAWLHVRASNTEPIMRLIAEAPTATDARAILDEAAKVIAKG